MREENLRANGIQNIWASYCVLTMDNLEQVGNSCHVKAEAELHFVVAYWFRGFNPFSGICALKFVF